MLTASNIRYELAERTRAISAGGIGLIHKLTKAVGLDDAINRRVKLLKLNMPYHESDHMLNIAYNVLAGGTCLKHLELLRTNEAFLDALGARRIPDPATAGDFCRRFSRWDIFLLQENFNEVTDAAENWKPSKKRSRERIDRIVATIMALGIADETPVAPPRGVLIRRSPARRWFPTDDYGLERREAAGVAAQGFPVREFDDAPDALEMAVPTVV